MNLDRTIWRPITHDELLQLSYDEREELLSYCWKHGEPRCWCIGIHGVVSIYSTDHKAFKLTWSDDDGDPSILVNGDEKIDGVWNDRYSYGLYKKI
jgi:hypothetical protein